MYILSKSIDEINFLILISHIEYRSYFYSRLIHKIEVTVFYITLLSEVLIKSNSCITNDFPILKVR